MPLAPADALGQTVNCRNGHAIVSWPWGFTRNLLDVTANDDVSRWRRLYRAFSKVTTPTIDEARTDLWSPQADAEHWSNLPPAYYSTLLEQYKIYVEMADRVSARRGLANTFFLTFNSAVFTLIGALWTARPHATSTLLIVPVLVLMAQCLAWFWLIRSYRQLNAAKYAVVGALEERLPASPYWRAEWKALGEGKDPARYLPLTHLEEWIPILFAVAYLSGFIAILAS